MSDEIQQKKIDKLSKQCLRFLAGLSLLLMLLLIVVGLLTMTLGLVPLLRSLIGSIAFEFKITGSVPNPVSPAVGFALGAALDGLEFVFLAPLAFLLLHGIWDFVADVRTDRFKELETFPASLTFLVRIKGLVIGLMIAVVAAELLKKSVGEHGLSIEAAIAGALLIAVLAAYSFIIERGASNEREMSARDVKNMPESND